MTEGRLRPTGKTKLPRPVRRLLRAGLHYWQRVSLWPIILWQVQGATWADQWVLIRSAMVAPFLSFDSLDEWQDPVLLADVEVVVADVGRFRLRKRSDDLYHVLPWREQGIFSEISKLLKPGDVFVDAGANIGVYTILASRLVGPGGRVVCVEMMSDTADRLEDNIRINCLSNVRVVRKALSDIAGQTIMATVEPGKYGRASIADRDGGLLSKVPVSTTTLDDVANGIETIRLMKMDIEGVELSALIGGKALMRRLNYLIYENWGVSNGDHDTVDALLVAAGFELSMIDGNNWLATNRACDQ